MRIRMGELSDWAKLPRLMVGHLWMDTAISMREAGGDIRVLAS
jgi:hypothetical protein